MNRLPGRITLVQTHGSIALVDAAVGSHRLTATLIGAGEETAAWAEGMPVVLLFKETEVSLAKNLSGMISLRNRLPATVRAIERGTLLTRVTLDFNGHTLDSIITTRSSQVLSLAVGDAVEALIKANEMSVMPEEDA